MKAVVTGASGFIGGHLAAQLAYEGWEVVAARRGGGASGAEQLLADLRNAAPDVIFHLAGLTHAADSGSFYEANTVLAARVLDVASQLTRSPVVVLAGSAAEYGYVTADAVPVNEAQPCRPHTDYAISKYAQTLLGLARATAGLKVIVARIWNAVGPGMPPRLALSSFAAEIAALPKSGGVLRVGNLDVERDFIDVREAVRLLAALARHPEAVGQVVNICSGRSWKLRTLVEAMIELADRPISVMPDPTRMRPGETPSLYGDITKLSGLGLYPAPPDFGVILPAMLKVARAGFSS